MFPKTLLLFLLNLKASLAQHPIFYVPPGTTPNIGFKMVQGYEDALTLARVASIAGTNCDREFVRYFQPQDFEFVQSMFRAIAGFDPTQPITDADIDQVLSAPPNANPLFGELAVSYGDNPFRVAGAGVCTDDDIAVYNGAKPGFGFEGVMSVCPGSTFFAYLLSLADTENPPVWARVGGNPQGQPLPGFGCDGFGDHDSSYMMTTGFILLHEMMHWQGLFEGIVPDYERLIRDQYDQNIVDDYPGGQGILSGYGPYNTMLINRLPANPDTGESQSLQNAENYAWYATAKYWSLKCGKYFGPSWSAADEYAVDNRQSVPDGW